MSHKEYWEQVYTTRASDEVSWFQEHAALSLRLIQNTGLGKDAAIIDVGGGASTLVDDLAAEGYSDLTVLDLSASALALAKQHIGQHAEAVHWMEGDITQAQLPVNRLDIWHDRAVFHFLMASKDRAAYVERVTHATRPGGYVIIAIFAEDGPEKCSGLPVRRYCPETLQTEFGDTFSLIKYQKEAHHTPSGAVQQFVYCHFRKRE